ncbi:MAG: AAA family ATPase [Acidobacteriia bacterium]|nr:AAA family ATPase [Terriglobia bacterium]
MDDPSTALGAGQHDVVAFLSTPSAYGTPAARVERIDTHISIVWLVGERVYKLKRAVRFDYVDFSTIERRRAACEAEVRLNRRTAPSLYLGVRPVTREADGSLAIDGRGMPVDWLVEMARFDEATLFDRLADGPGLDLGLMEGLADAIADFHAVAEPQTTHGGRDGMAWVIDGNALGFAEQGRGVLDPPACERLTAATRFTLGRHQDLLEARRRRGMVRRCHGDLHLRNICLLGGRPTLFDAIEFNDEIACVDVLYDLAFLLMDLWRRTLRAHANVVFNEYLTRTRDLAGLPLVPLFLACRAAVRAKTSATAAAVQPDESRRTGLEAAARQYLALAQTFLSPPMPRLAAIGGLSGSGKSTVARRLAPEFGAAPGALVLRSDVIRKALYGVSPLTRLDDDAYTPEMSRLVYRTIAERARVALEGGHSVIADAVYALPAERDAIADVARAAGVRFDGLWIDAPPAILERRLAARHADASDADARVLQGQLQRDVGRVDWTRVDGSADVDRVSRGAAAAVGAA